MVFTLFLWCSKQPPEVQFWTWFEENQEDIFHFERNQEAIFNKLHKALTRVHRDLTFEFGPIEDGKRVFVLSADGLKGAFPAVESLHASAPSLPRWTFIKFRPRRPAMAIQIEDFRLEPSDVEVAIEPDGDKAGLTLFIRDYSDARKNQFLQIAFLMLDQAIGEYDMITGVGFVEIKPFDQRSQYPRYSFADLPQMFDRFMEK
jgi:hypothetical protein